MKANKCPINVMSLFQSKFLEKNPFSAILQDSEWSQERTYRHVAVEGGLCLLCLSPSKSKQDSWTGNFKILPIHSIKPTEISCGSAWFSGSPAPLVTSWLTSVWWEPGITTPCWVTERPQAGGFLLNCLCMAEQVFERKFKWVSSPLANFQLSGPDFHIMFYGPCQPISANLSVMKLEDDVCPT